MWDGVMGGLRQSRGFAASGPKPVAPKVAAATGGAAGVEEERKKGAEHHVRVVLLRVSACVRAWCWHGGGTMVVDGAGRLQGVTTRRAGWGAGVVLSWRCSRGAGGEGMVVSARGALRHLALGSP